MRRLRWVLLREATVCVLLQLYAERLDEATWRAVLSRQDTDRVERHLGILLARYPYTRFYPAVDPLSIAARVLPPGPRRAEHRPR